MAKRKSKRSRQRDLAQITTRSVLGGVNLNQTVPWGHPLHPARHLVTQSAPRRRLREVEDRREFHPERLWDPTPRMLSGAPRRRLIAKPIYAGRPPNSPLRNAGGYRPLNMAGPTHRLMFQRPKQLVLCVRRTIRKQVIFATGHGGRNGATKYRRNHNSEVSC